MADRWWLFGRHTLFLPLRRAFTEPHAGPQASRGSGNFLGRQLRCVLGTEEQRASTHRHLLQTHPSSDTSPHHRWVSRSQAGRPAAQTVCARLATALLVPADEEGNGFSAGRSSAKLFLLLLKLICNFTACYLVFIRRLLLNQRRLNSSLGEARLHIRERNISAKSTLGQRF